MLDSNDNKPILKKRRKNANMRRETEKALNALRPNEPGVSLNPLGWGGRPYQELIRICRDLSPQAMEVLMYMMEQKETKPGYALDAAKFIIERGWGKTPMEVKLAYEDKYRQMSDAELDEKVRQIMDSAGIVNAEEILQESNSETRMRLKAARAQYQGGDSDGQNGPGSGPSGQDSEGFDR